MTGFAALICFLIVAAFISVVYFLYMFRGFLSLRFDESSLHKTIRDFSTHVSIIVATRNEASNILNCLEALVSQKYPSNLFEIIVSDDFSDDKTIDLCRQFIHLKKIEPSMLKIIKSKEGENSGKKSALERGISESNGELILTTDADCTMDQHWLQSYVAIYEKTKPKMITGFVKIYPVENLLGLFQAFELLSLSGSSAISVNLKRPLMCSGANLAFSKQAFYDVGGYSYGRELASGDDTFLMLKMASQYPNDLMFNKSVHSVVGTNAAKNVFQFIEQRVRWASKVKFYNELYIKLFGIFFFVANLIPVLILFLSIIRICPWEIAALFWTIKMIPDLFVLIPSAKFSRQTKLLFLILPMQIIYPFYAIAGFFISLLKSNYEWKGRKF